MKLRLLTAGLLACLTVGYFQQDAAAASNWASKCEKVQPNENPTSQQTNCLLTNAAIDADIPPEVVKAIATQENGWRQFDKSGNPIISNDGGIGLMQITNKANYDQEKLKYDIYYNIEAGIETLNNMYNRNDLPKIKGADRQVIENWYFPVMAYNGIKPVNSPLYQLTGEKNINAYQEKVFTHIGQYSFLKDTPLGTFPFQTTDFQYDPTSTNNINFLKKEYTLTDQMHLSTNLFKKDDKVVVTKDQVNLRQSINTATGAKKIAINTNLMINGPVQYDNTNQFVWYPVKTLDLKVKGYISSAYITKKLDTTVKLIDDNDTSASGTAPANSIIQIMKGKTEIGSTIANTSGNFVVKIDKQKANTKLTFSIKDPLNRPIPSVTKTVIDKTAPNPPQIGTIKKITKVITGKTEPYAIVQLKFGSKPIPSVKADKYGTFKITIKPQKSGTNVYVTATDLANNTSKATKTKVK